MKATLSLIALMIFISCAGPNDPFGPMSLEQTISQEKKKKLLSFREIQSTGQGRIKIQFDPPARPYLQVQKWSVKFTSQKPITNFNGVRFYLNGRDITKKVTDQGSWKLSLDKKTLTMDHQGVRFLGNGADHFVATFRDEDQVVMKTYRAPKCLLRDIQMVTHHGGFPDKQQLIHEISFQSLRAKMNPAMINSLVARESSFNPRAVSWAKAIGLTQVTTLANEMILKEKDFQTLEKIKTLPVPVVKALIKMNRITPAEEWRLDPEKSIIGGLAYLEMVEDYWRIPINRRLQEQFAATEEDLTDLILASYNSGPYRVKKALKNHQFNWRQASYLREARKYFLNIKSYCQEFTKPEGLLSATEENIHGT